MYIYVYIYIYIHRTGQIYFHFFKKLGTQKKNKKTGAQSEDQCACLIEK